MSWHPPRHVPGVLMRFFAHMLGKIISSSKSNFIAFRQFFFFFNKNIQKFKKIKEKKVGLSMGVEAWDTFQMSYKEFKSIIWVISK
jgi:hypothetical protein